MREINYSQGGHQNRYSIVTTITDCISYLIYPHKSLESHIPERTALIEIEIKA